MQFIGRRLSCRRRLISLVNLDGPVVIRVGDGTATSAAETAPINSVLIGNQGLNKSDAGTLVLNGSNRYSGGVAIHGGSISVQAPTWAIQTTMSRCKMEICVSPALNFAGAARIRLTPLQMELPTACVFEVQQPGKCGCQRLGQWNALDVDLLHEIDCGRGLSVAFDSASIC